MHSACANKKTQQTLIILRVPVVFTFVPFLFHCGLVYDSIQVHTTIIVIVIVISIGIYIGIAVIVIMIFLIISFVNAIIQIL